ncbi:MAG: gamma-glutamyltransferase [Woeseia sp.]
MTRVAVATTSALAAEAAAEVAELGGNAVDCAIAAVLLTMNTEPGVCALAGSAYVTVWPAAGDPVTIDGNAAVPGIGRGTAGSLSDTDTVDMAYGGGIRTTVGAPSVAVPGTLAALDRASRQYGRADWRALVEPSVRAARDGFPLSAACHYYLGYSGLPVFGRSIDGYHSLHDENGTLRAAGSRIKVPWLADSLAAIAREGASIFYEGELANAITNHVQEGGGALTRDDLRQYRAIVREPLFVELDGWRIATNPPPAIGGATLAAMLEAFRRQPARQWDAMSLGRLVEVQQLVLGFRREHLDLAKDVGAEAAKLLAIIREAFAGGRRESASTVHTSAVDADGNACAITASSGYGSGEMPARTGLWLNNCLGELELNRHGLDAGPPGRRLPSNMAPGAARRTGRVLAFGSPGADRITTALQQFLINFIQQGMNLGDAVAHPRVHVECRAGGDRLAVEPGVGLPEMDVPVTEYPAINMYFGGVGAAMHSQDAGFQVAADPRREGAVFVSDG